jgi:methionyl-tRNA formyltransferase
METVPRVVFLGSPKEVIKPLERLIDLDRQSKIQLVCVISQPARPAGRKRLLTDPPVATFSKEQGIPTLQPESARDEEFLCQFAALRPDIAITAAYGQILSQKFLSIPNRATINIHPSMLPKYRGATPVPAAILAGDKESGVSILFTVKALDAGNIIIQEKSPVADDEVAGEMTERLFDRGGCLLEAAIERLKDREFAGQPQDEGEVSHCRKINKEDGLINWRLSAQEIHNRHRAHQPWPGSYTFLDQRQISIVEMTPPLQAQSPGDPGSFEYVKTLSALIVATGAGHLGIKKLRIAGGKDMDASSFWNGIGQKVAIRQFRNEL